MASQLHLDPCYHRVSKKILGVTRPHMDNKVIGVEVQRRVCAARKIGGRKFLIFLMDRNFGGLLITSDCPRNVMIVGDRDHHIIDASTRCAIWRNHEMV